MLAWPGRDQGNPGPRRPTGSRPCGVRPRRLTGHPRAARWRKTARRHRL